jgi:hypothetical protein
MLSDMTETDDIILLSLSGSLEKSDVEKAMPRFHSSRGERPTSGRFQTFSSSPLRRQGRR